MSGPLAKQVHAERSGPDFGTFVDCSICPVMALDRDFHIVYANDAYLGAVHRSRADILGKSYFDAFQHDPECVEEVLQTFNRVLGGESARTELLPVHYSAPDGCHSVSHWHSMIEPQRDASGEIAFLIQRGQDISEQVRLQQSNDLISAELDHRVKNLVSVILATARISSATAESVEQYTEEFCDRLESMTRSYNLLSANGWKGLSFRSVFEDEIAHAVGRNSDRYSIKGDDLILNLKGTKDASMIIHELVANAVKFGCFSVPEGRLDIEWRVDGEMLRIVWCETGMTGVREPARVGFGTKLLSMMPNARVHREFRNTGMWLTYEVPLDLVIDLDVPANKRAGA